MGHRASAEGAREARTTAATLNNITHKRRRVKLELRKTARRARHTLFK